MHSLVFIDTETTGLDPQKCDLIELSAVRVINGKKVSKFDSLVRPFSDIPESIIKLTGITNEEVSNAPTLEKVREKFLNNFLKPDDILVAHNAQFDIDFLNTKDFKLALPYIDTFEIAQIIYPEKKSLALESLTIELQIDHQNAHRALADTLATFELRKKMQEVIKTKWDQELFLAAEEILKKSSWVGKLFFEECQSSFQKKDKPMQNSLFENIVFDEKSIKLPNEHEATAAKQIAQKIGENPKLALEVESPLRTEIVTLLTAKELANDRKIGIAFYAKDREKILQTKQNLDFNNLKVALIDLPENYLCLEKWQNFLNNNNFKDYETTLALKILQKINLQNKFNIANFNLYGIQRDVFLNQLAEESSSTCQNCPFFDDLKNLETANIVIMPMEANKLFDGKCLIINKADDLEEQLTTIKKIEATLAFFERMATNYSEEKYHKFFDGLFFGFGFLSKFIKEKLGESQYSESLRITVKEEASIEYRNFASFFLEAKKELRELFAEEKNGYAEIEKWSQFFDQETQKNEIKYLTIYPNNSVSCTRTHISLKDSFQEVCNEVQSIVLVANNFPKKISENKSNIFPNFEFLSNDFIYSKIPSNYNYEQKSAFIAPITIKNDDEKDAEIISEYISIIDTNNIQNILCVFSSVNFVEKIENILSQKLKASSSEMEIVSHLYGNTEKTKNKFLNKKGKKLFLIPFRAAMNFDFENLNFDIFFLQKLIFDPPGNPLAEERKSAMENGFLDYLLPKAIANFLKLFKQAVNQSGRFIFYCTDPKIVQLNSWGKHFFDALPESLPKKFLAKEQINIFIKDFYKTEC